MACKEIKEVEADDPMELVAVVLPADAESAREMAYAFAEEFARMGYDAGQIETLFRTPFYAAAHQAFLALGEAEIQTIIGECVAAWGGVVTRVRDKDNGTVPFPEGDRNGDSPLSGMGTVPFEIDLNVRREESEDG